MRFFGSELDLVFEDCATISTLLSAGNGEHRLWREFQAAGCSADPGSQGQRWIGDVRHWQHGDHPVGNYRYHVRVLLNYFHFMRQVVEVAYGDDMPTLTVTHEAPLELIRQCPGVAVDLVRAMTGVPLPADPKADLGPTSLNAVVPAEFTADAVVVVTDRATEAPALVIVVEPQGRDDKTKAYSWPAYLAIVREAVKCPSAVLLRRTTPAGYSRRSAVPAALMPSASGSPQLS
jgi:hypothetical protein